MYDNALAHSKFASHSYLVHACVQTPPQTDQLSQPVHTLASNLLIQPVDRAEQIDPVRLRYMKINHCGFNAPMTQQLLDRYNVHTKLQKMCSITVPERVYTDTFSKTTPLYRFPDNLLNANCAKGSARFAAIKQIIYRMAGITIPLYSFENKWRQWNIPILIVFALTDVDHHPA